MDQTLIGETAAALMDTLPDEAEGEILAVGIIVVVDAGEAGTYQRVKCSSELHHEQVGLFQVGLDVLRGVGGEGD